MNGPLWALEDRSSAFESGQLLGVIDTTNPDAPVVVFGIGPISRSTAPITKLFASDPKRLLCVAIETILLKGGT